ncbi:hypothetical protein [Glacieibacterium frigidum]|uniref:Phosphatidate cytidylyltransferase n=1 Tax=Glacieibacterium frigidum TaxID=2593303 RepID=A0A552U9S7_9SPHN|nr:hypothetical protein [Glacieibacterium frigidum]TRW14973.1 hypothetical protein FMM06_15045 [Glacieibacterium frigidum]
MPPEASRDDLRTLVAAELAVPIDPAAADFAAHVATILPGTNAVLFYGSCLREARLDGLMLDFYVIVDDYTQSYGDWRARANRLIPPNVFQIAHDGLRAKYAVLSSADLARLCSSATSNPSVWARFAQPSRLAWVRDDDARNAAIAAVAGAAPALLAAAAPMLPPVLSVEALWTGAFALTFGAELRTERAGRGNSIVAADPARYAAFTAPALAAAGLAATVDGDRVEIAGGDRAAAPAAWARRRRAGKALSAARLAKAAFTFDGGLDYLAWKIQRHAGVPVPVSAWMRRWPLLGGIALLPRLLARGAVR